MMHELVSVVIPVRDRAGLVVQTLGSLRAQTHGAWEAIVVDDGSADDTVEAVRKLAAGDERVRLIERSRQPAGANACRNIGVEAARGEFVVLLDSDDLLAPTALEGRVEAMRRRPELDFGVFLVEMFAHTPGDTDRLWNHDTGEDDLDRFLRGDIPWQTTSAMWRRQALVGLGPLDEALLSFQDSNLHIRAIAMGRRYARFPIIDTWVRTEFGGHRTVGLSSRSPEHLRSHLRRVGLECDLLIARSLMTPRRRLLMAGNYFWLAEWYVEMGLAGEANEAWSECRRRRLIGGLRYRQGAAYLARPWGLRTRALAYAIARLWPPEMFVMQVERVRQAPKSSPWPRRIGVTGKGPRRFAHDPIIRFGVVRGLCRRLEPGDRPIGTGGADASEAR